jgi:uncharacterized protein (TIGR02145 family)
VFGFDLKWQQLQDVIEAMDKKSTIWHCVLSLSGFAMICSGCGNDDSIQIPTLTTANITAITSTTAIGGGVISADGGSPLTETGLCWSTMPSPVITANRTSDGSSVTFSSNLAGLVGNTTYFVRAYATNIAGTGYGNEISFTTLVDEIKIGSQIWMRRNLDVTKYQNGDPIPNVTEGNSWLSQTKGAYSDYDNSTSNANVYGRLYNWYAVADSRNVCPVGWHVSTNDDWQTLTDVLGGVAVAGGQLKEAGTVHWHEPNLGAGDQSGFSALPGGHRYTDAGFYNLGVAGYWWTSTEVSASNSSNRVVSSTNSGVSVGNFAKTGGFSVRCVKN